MTEFDAALAADVELVNQALDALLPRGAGEYGVVERAMRYSLEAGGKRVRPVLALEFCRMLGGDGRKALPLACGVELVHTYSLIHDDLPCMDDDALRRGKPSCHIAYGEANALLAGDGLLTLAFSLLAQAPATHGTSPEAALAACRVLSERAGVRGMVGGQVMDLADEGRRVEVEILRETCLKKTSALLEAACMLGVLAAGGGEGPLALAGEYARHLGLAFQMVDDILDVTADETALGKPVGSDAAQEKATWVSLLGLEGAKGAAEEETGAALRILEQLPAASFLRTLTMTLLRRSA